MVEMKNIVIVNENLEEYKENFDVIILNDRDFNYINKLLKEIIK